jgi:hypothetical protein
MEITEKQLQQIARSICVLDIKAYIEQHYEDYKKFLEEDAESKE